MAEWKTIIYGITALQERFDAGEIPFEEMRDGVAKILRHKLKTRLDFEHDNYDMSLRETIEELEEVDTVDYYDTVKSVLYDWCDDNRVWIDPFL